MLNVILLIIIVESIRMCIQMFFSYSVTARIGPYKVLGKRSNGVSGLSSTELRALGSEPQQATTYYRYMHKCTHVRTYTHTFMYTCAYTYTCLYTHVYNRVLISGRVFDSIKFNSCKRTSKNDHTLCYRTNSSCSCEYGIALSYISYCNNGCVQHATTLNAQEDFCNHVVLVRKLNCSPGVLRHVAVANIPWSVMISIILYMYLYTCSHYTI